MNRITSLDNQLGLQEKGLNFWEKLDDYGRIQLISNLLIVFCTVITTVCAIITILK